MTTSFLHGTTLVDYVANLQVNNRIPRYRRECHFALMEYLKQGIYARVALLSGYKGTGKTTMLWQALEDLPHEVLATRTAYLDATPGTLDMDAVDSMMRELFSNGITHFVIDGATNIKDLSVSASVLANYYCTFYGGRVVLAGDNPLMFSIAMDDTLYDRAFVIETGNMSYVDYKAIYGDDCDVVDYLANSGIMFDGLVKPVEVLTKKDLENYINENIISPIIEALNEAPEFLGVKWLIEDKSDDDIRQGLGFAMYDVAVKYLRYIAQDDTISCDIISMEHTKIDDKLLNKYKTILEQGKVIKDLDGLTRLYPYYYSYRIANPIILCSAINYAMLSLIIGGIATNLDSDSMSNKIIKQLLLDNVYLYGKRHGPKSDYVNRSLDNGSVFFYYKPNNRLMYIHRDYPYVRDHFYMCRIDSTYEELDIIDATFDFGMYKEKENVLIIQPDEYLENLTGGYDKLFSI